ncbi:LemA family protein [Candidatus Gracilibacteria bacterium]|nr:LemA family protein [Candidatus Gracilibacteria bacterium]
MKKYGLFFGLGILGLMIYSFITGSYNTMVTLDEGVLTQWSQVENQYQRRADLIPNIVSTVKGYATHEKTTLESVIEARSKATQTNVNIKDGKAIAAFQATQSELSSALSRLMVVVEKYPELKANQNFLELQAQLEGTENRIAVARKDYNLGVKKYNIYIRKFPKNMIANMFNFEKTTLFEAQKGASQVPSVEF